MSDKQDEVTCIVYPSQPNVIIERGTDIKVHPYYLKHYGQLIGKTVKRVVVHSFEQDPRSLLPILEFTDGTSAAVMMDPECNGPGHLDIQTP